jgi:hypothetical protein
VIDIPVTWLTYCDDNPARGRWDQMWVGRLLDGEEWLPPSPFRFVESGGFPGDDRGTTGVG